MCNTTFSRVVGLFFALLAALSARAQGFLPDDSATEALNAVAIAGAGTFDVARDTISISAQSGTMIMVQMSQEGGDADPLSLFGQLEIVHDIPMPAILADYFSNTDVSSATLSVLRAAISGVGGSTHVYCYRLVITPLSAGSQPLDILVPFEVVQTSNAGIVPPTAVTLTAMIYNVTAEQVTRNFDPRIYEPSPFGPQVTGFKKFINYPSQNCSSLTCCICKAYCTYNECATKAVEDGNEAMEDCGAEAVFDILTPPFINGYIKAMLCIRREAKRQDANVQRCADNLVSNLSNCGANPK